MSEGKSLSIVNAYTPDEVQGQAALIQSVMKKVMKKDVHYGTVAGCGSKPVLLKPGAEKLASTFRLSPRYEIEDLSNSDKVEYKIKTSIYVTNQKGEEIFLGSGVGCCSSDEEKYKWKAPVCVEEYDETPDQLKRIKWKKGYKGGKATSVKQIRTNPADIANTVLKMGKKRSFIDAVLTVTAASDIFEQDLEDMPEGILDAQHEDPTSKASVTPPQERPAPAKKEAVPLNASSSEKASGKQEQPEQPPRSSAPNLITEKQISYIQKLAHEAGMFGEDLDKEVNHLHQTTIENLNKAQASEFIEYLQRVNKDG